MLLSKRWNVKGKNLYKQIEALGPEVSPDFREALHAIREIGNQGAHASISSNDVLKEIRQQDAEKLIRVIEVILEDWKDERKRKDQIDEARALYKPPSKA